MVRTLAFHAYQMRGQPVTRDFVLIIGKAGIQIPVTALYIRIHILELLIIYGLQLAVHKQILAKNGIIYTGATQTRS